MAFTRQGRITQAADKILNLEAKFGRVGAGIDLDGTLFIDTVAVPRGDARLPGFETMRRLDHLKMYYPGAAHALKLLAQFMDLAIISGNNVNNILPGLECIPG